ncbi:MAG: aldo/keto reductase [Chloroflexota bacterium]
MEYRKLGNSGLKITEIGLGCNTFGNKTDEATAKAIVDLALEKGINFLDTAELYARGRSEEMVGKALKGRRSRVILATKFAHMHGLQPHEAGGSRDYIMKAVERSLGRLDTDYIDLYYFHFPDANTPIEETLRAMDDLVRSGKVRYIGCSNFAAWQLAGAVWTSRSLNLHSFIAVQSRYNLLDRSIEAELVPCCQTYGVGVIPWGPLAAGFLTGKYPPPGKPIPETMRLSRSQSIYDDVITPENYAKLTRLEAYAKERGHRIGELAVAWLLAHPWLGSVIAGAVNPEQLSENIKGADWKLTAEELTEVNSLC